jgi:hypothetical protein
MFAAPPRHNSVGAALLLALRFLATVRVFRDEAG